MTSDDYLKLSSLYGLISRMWVPEVDLHFLQQLNDPDIKSAIERLGGVVPEATESNIENLAVDYCQIFVGPKNHIPPVQSVFEENKFQGKPATSMKNYMDSIPGFQPVSNIPDHFGVQLQLMSELLFGASKPDFQDSFQTIASGFLMDHLAWSLPYLERVESKAETEFYRGLAKMTREFLEAELSESE